MCACWSDIFFILSKIMRKDYLIRLFYAAVGRNLHMNVKGRSGEFLRNCQAQIYLKYRQVKVQEEFNFYFIVQKETRVCMRFSSFALNFFKTHLGSDDAKGKNTNLHLLLQSSKVFQFFTSLQKFFLSARRVMRFKKRLLFMMLLFLIQLKKAKLSNIEPG